MEIFVNPPRACYCCSGRDRSWTLQLPACDPTFDRENALLAVRTASEKKASASLILARVLFCLPFFVSLDHRFKSRSHNSSPAMLLTVVICFLVSGVP